MFKMTPEFSKITLNLSKTTLKLQELTKHCLKLFKICPNLYRIVQNDLKIVENYSRFVQNYKKSIQNDLKIIPSDSRIVQNYTRFVQIDLKSLKSSSNSLDYDHESLDFPLTKPTEFCSQLIILRVHPVKLLFFISPMFQLLFNEPEGVGRSQETLQRLKPGCSRRFWRSEPSKALLCGSTAESLCGLKLHTFLLNSVV